MSLSETLPEVRLPDGARESATTTIRIRNTEMNVTGYECEELRFLEVCEFAPPTAKKYDARPGKPSVSNELFLGVVVNALIF